MGHRERRYNSEPYKLCDETEFIKKKKRVRWDEYAWRGSYKNAESDRRERWRGTRYRKMIKELEALSMEQTS